MLLKNNVALAGRAEKLVSGIVRPAHKIGVRLALSFIVIILLMAVGYAVALWQFRELRAQQQNLDTAYQESAAVLNLNAHLFAFKDRLEDLSDAQRGSQFVLEANGLRKGLLNDIERAKRALEDLPPNVERDSFVLVSLDTVESALPVQIDAMSDLAKANDWSAIRLRSQNQMRQLSYLTSALVDKVASGVAVERARVLRNTQLTEFRFLLTLIGAGSVTLLVAAALGLAVTRSITRPLALLDRGAKSLARGAFQYEVAVAGQDELADLAKVFNRTARQLQDLYQNLQANEARFRSLIEHSSDFIVVLDREGAIRYVSPSSEHVLGLKSENLVGKEILFLIHPDDLARIRSVLGAGTSTAIQIFEFRYRHPGREERIIEAVKTNLLDNPAVAGVVVNARDITERRRAEQELRRNEAFLAEGERLSHTGSWVWKLGSDAMSWSQEHFRILGYDSCKPSLDLFWERIHPEDRVRLRQTFEKAIREKHDVETEFRIIQPDGAVRFIASVSHAVADETGQLIEFVGTSMDITERKRADDALQQMQAQLAHVARVASMGELTASIAHEVSQPLTGIIVNATAGLRWLAAEPPNLERVRESLARINRDGNRAAAVVTRIRALFKKSPFRAEKLDINESIGEVIALIGSEVRAKNITIETQLADSLPPISGDRIQLQQVLLNLIVNAIEAMSETHDPRILGVKSWAESVSGSVSVSVCDSGPGLDSVNTVNLFEAFYTTKPEGTGMGLAISRSIVSAHGGQLNATSNEGRRGATFEFSLPAID
jgi:PAS domain S-box-containing protein